MQDRVDWDMVEEGMADWDKVVQGMVDWDKVVEDKPEGRAERDRADWLGMVEWGTVG